MLARDVYKLLERTADAAFVVSLEGEICSWNPASEQLFGYTQADVQNRTCHEILRGKGALGTSVCDEQCSVQRCAARNEPVTAFDLEVATADHGQRKWVSISTIVLEDSRLHRKLIAHLCHDISKRKESEKVFSQIVELSKHLATIGEDQGKPAPSEFLSDQERRVLLLFAKARNAGQIAKELKITLPTLRNHLHSINQKLRTHNRLEAVLHAMRRGLI